MVVCACQKLSAAGIAMKIRSLAVPAKSAANQMNMYARPARQAWQNATTAHTITTYSPIRSVGRSSHCSIGLVNTRHGRCGARSQGRIDTDRSVAEEWFGYKRGRATEGVPERDQTDRKIRLGVPGLWKARKPFTKRNAVPARSGCGHRLNIEYVPSGGDYAKGSVPVCINGPTRSACALCSLYG